MTDSIGTILTSSFGVFKAKLKPILLGAILLGLLMHGSQLLFQEQAMKAVSGNPMMNMQKMEDLAERAGQGDQAALDELMKQAEMFEGSLPDEAAMNVMGAQMIMSLAPSFGVFFLVSLFLSLVASAYYLILAIDSKSTLQTALSSTPKLILPLLGVWLWSFIRSFAWIPAIGIVFAIVLGPRFILSPVILVKEKKGVLESVSLSYERSRGYWGKIFGNSIVAGICMWIAMVVVAFVASLLGQTLALPITVITGYAGAAFGTIFVVKLSETILANPLKVAKK